MPICYERKGSCENLTAQSPPWPLPARRSTHGLSQKPIASELCRVTTVQPCDASRLSTRTRHNPERGIMTNVMQPRAWLPRPCTQPELAQEEKEGLIHGRISQGLPSQRDKHMCLRACQLLATIQVEGQLLCCRWMKRHKPTFSELRLADVKSVRTDVIDLECERLGDPQAAGRHQPEERVESMRPQGSCRRELLCFGEDCGDLGRCEDVRSTARTRVMSKDFVRRNL